MTIYFDSIADLVVVAGWSREGVVAEGVVDHSWRAAEMKLARNGSAQLESTPHLPNGIAHERVNEELIQVPRCPGETDPRCLISPKETTDRAPQLGISHCSEVLR